MVIETYGLTKQYNGHGGCVDITLNIDEGTVFGFLGPNGAGKSTLVKTMVGLLYPTSGTAKILGSLVGDTEVKKRIGYLPENFKYHDWMTGYENLKFHAELYGIKDSNRRIEQLLELTKLTGHEKKRVSGYSKGMQQRLGLASALLADPDVLFLDEPTSALDPVGRIEVREIIRDLKSRGKTVFLNSHLLSEVEMVCDEVAIINCGRIIARGKLEELLHSDTRIEAIIGEPSPGLADTLLHKALEVRIRGNTLYVKVRNYKDIPVIAKLIIESGTLLYELKTSNSSLEKLFVNLLKGDSDYDNHNEIYVQGNA